MSRLGLARPAVRYGRRGRVLFAGPSGAGASFEALRWATRLAAELPGDGDGSTLVIDTNHDASSTLADRFAFDVVPWAAPFDPSELAETITAASARSSLVIDSLSAFWEAEGGTLDQVDAAARRSRGGDNRAGWRSATPALRDLVDAIHRSHAHVVVTLRSKTDWVVEVDPDTGAHRTRRIALEPIGPRSIEADFDLFCTLGLDGRATVEKGPPPACTPGVQMDRVFSSDVDDTIGDYVAWLAAGTGLRRVDAKAAVLELLDGDVTAADEAWRACADDRDWWSPEAFDAVVSAVAEHAHPFDTPTEPATPAVDQPQETPSDA